MIAGSRVNCITTHSDWQCGKINARRYKRCAGSQETLHGLRSLRKPRPRIIRRQCSPGSGGARRPGVRARLPGSCCSVIIRTSRRCIVMTMLCSTSRRCGQPTERSCFQWQILSFAGWGPCAHPLIRKQVPLALKPILIMLLLCWSV